MEDEMMSLAYIMELNAQAILRDKHNGSSDAADQYNRSFTAPSSPFNPLQGSLDGNNAAIPGNLFNNGAGQYTNTTGPAEPAENIMDTLKELVRKVNELEKKVEDEERATKEDIGVSSERAIQL